MAPAGLGRTGSSAYDRDNVAAPSGPTEGGTSTAQGRPHSIFKRAIQRRNVVAALAAARELPQLSLIDALELTMLIARKDSSRYPRVAARWLQRFLDKILWTG